MDRGEKAGGEEEAAPGVVADVAAAAAEASPDQEKSERRFRLQIIGNSPCVGPE